VFELIDPAMPRLISELSGSDIDCIVRKHFEDLTGEDWSNVDLAPFWSLYDPRKAADRLK
jgi:hypothetical protein